MIFRIASVLDELEVRALKDFAAGQVFERGARTAGWSARTVKDNEQLTRGPAATRRSRCSMDLPRT